MEMKIANRKQNCYSLFFSDFSQKEENKFLNFSEKSVKAAQIWKSLDATEKNKYRVLSEVNGAEMNKSKDKDSNNEVQVLKFKERYKVHLCGSCGRNFKAAFRMKYHSKTCGNVESECPTCKKTFKTQEGLQKHMRFVHSKEKLHTCSQCDKQFVCRADLRAHHNIHEGLRFSCEQCDSTISNMSNKLKHCKKYH